ncbi:MAG: NAD-dependent epimerase/dehydratase family protein [Betaproteobacteria bacterium]
MRILITGASGFVGQALARHLEAQGFEVRRAVRALSEKPAAGQTNSIAVGEVGPDTDWQPALDGVDVVVHLAARAHVMDDRTGSSLNDYRRINVEGTRRLARIAAQSQVKRIVFLSSIKVNGESTKRPFTDRDVPSPKDDYAISKWEAEQALMQESQGSAMQWVALRAPLLYGPDVRANFLRLMHAVVSEKLLPFAAIRNRRSLMFLGNLTDCIARCLTHAACADRVFLLSDGEDLSTPELVRKLASALDVRANMIPIPALLLRIAGTLAGKGGAITRLAGSLQVDSSPICKTLDWSPPYSVEEGIAQTARWFRSVSQTAEKPG